MQTRTRTHTRPQAHTRRRATSGATRRDDAAPARLSRRRWPEEMKKKKSHSPRTRSLAGCARPRCWTRGRSGRIRPGSRARWHRGGGLRRTYECPCLLVGCLTWSSWWWLLELYKATRGGKNALTLRPVRLDCAWEKRGSYWVNSKAASSFQLWLVSGRPAVQLWTVASNKQ